MADNMDVTTPPTEEMGNRVFLIGAAILGGIFIVALIAIIALAIYLNSGKTNATPNLTATYQSQLAASQTATMYLWMTQLAQPTTAVPTATTKPTATKQPPTATTAATAVVNATSAPSETPTITPTGPTATGATATPAGSKTNTPGPTATALPKTGFGDSSGLPALVSIGLVLLVIVILARQLRFRRAGG